MIFTILLFAFISTRTFCEPLTQCSEYSPTCFCDWDKSLMNCSGPINEWTLPKGHAFYDRFEDFYFFEASGIPECLVYYKNIKMIYEKNCGPDFCDMVRRIHNEKITEGRPFNLTEIGCKSNEEGKRNRTNRQNDIPSWCL